MQVAQREKYRVAADLTVARSRETQLANELFTANEDLSKAEQQTAHTLTTMRGDVLSARQTTATVTAKLNTLQQELAEARKEALEAAHQLQIDRLKAQSTMEAALDETLRRAQQETAAAVATAVHQQREISELEKGELMSQVSVTNTLVEQLQKSLAQAVAQQATNQHNKLDLEKQVSGNNFFEHKPLAKARHWVQNKAQMPNYHFVRFSP